MKKPNIIYIFADQMRSHVLGCYGNKTVPTPHFDAMAQAGAKFDNAISTYPVCSPYRAMLLTGKHPMNNGTVSNDTGFKDGLESIATACKSDGYETGYIGKWHLEWNRDPFVPKHRRLGFDYWAVNNCTHKYMDHFYCMDTPEEIYFKGYDAIVQTDLAVDYIRAHQDAPFCLFISWGPPHDPYNNVPEKYKQRININDITLRPNVSDRSIVDPLLQRDEDRGQASPARQKRREIADDDEQLKKQQLHGYYAHTCALDDCIGKIRKALKELGLTNDTILVFSSDHGDMLGSHRMLSKQNPLEESISIPLLVEYPSAVKSSTQSDELIAPVDIMPTLLGLAGVSCPDVDGRDLSGTITGNSYEPRDAVLIMKMLEGGNPYTSNAIVPWRGVRTKRYTYACIVDDGPWLLFDNENDPYQLHNLIDNPEFAAIQDKLDKRMQELMYESGDPGDTETIKEYRKSMMPADRKNE